jgi:hypothetical protein
MQRVFENAGIEFIDENGGGPGVRLRKKTSACYLSDPSNVACTSGRQFATPMRSFNGNSGYQSSAGKYLGTGPLLTRQALVRRKNAYREAKKSALDWLPPVASALLHMNDGEL